jgi:hypothetical protein
MNRYKGFQACRVCRVNAIEAPILPMASMFDDENYANAFSLLSGYDVSLISNYCKPLLIPFSFHFR